MLRQALSGVLVGRCTVAVVTVCILLLLNADFSRAAGTPSRTATATGSRQLSVTLLPAAAVRSVTMTRSTSPSVAAAAVGVRSASATNTATANFPAQKSSSSTATLGPASVRTLTHTATASGAGMIRTPTPTTGGPEVVSRATDTRSVTTVVLARSSTRTLHPDQRLATATVTVAAPEHDAKTRTETQPAIAPTAVTATHTALPFVPLAGTRTATLQPPPPPTSVSTVTSTATVHGALPPVPPTVRSTTRTATVPAGTPPPPTALSRTATAARATARTATRTTPVDSQRTATVQVVTATPVATMSLVRTDTRSIVPTGTRELTGSRTQSANTVTPSTTPSGGSLSPTRSASNPTRSRTQPTPTPSVSETLSLFYTYPPTLSRSLPITDTDTETPSPSAPTPSMSGSANETVSGSVSPPPTATPSGSRTRRLTVSESVEPTDSHTDSRTAPPTTTKTPPPTRTATASVTPQLPPTRTPSPTRSESDLVTLTPRVTPSADVTETRSITGPTMVLSRPALPIIYEHAIQHGTPLERSLTYELEGDSFAVERYQTSGTVGIGENVTTLAMCVKLDVSRAATVNRSLHNLWSSDSLTFTRRTATVTFVRMPLFVLPVDGDIDEEVLIANFTPDCFTRRVVPEAASQYIAIRRGDAPATEAPAAPSAEDSAAAAERRRTEELVQMARDGAIAASLGSYFGAAAARNPIVALQASRSMVAIDIITCADGIDGDEPLPLSESLFPAAVGSSSVRYYVGALVTNTMLMLGLVGIHAVILFVVTVMQMAGSFGGSFRFPHMPPVLGKARFPQLLYPVYCAGAAVSVKHGFIVGFVSEDTATQIGASILAMPWFLGFPAVAFVVLSRAFTPRFHPYVPSTSLFAQLLRPVGMWQDVTGLDAYTDRFGAVFFHFVGQRVVFTVEELALSLAIAAGTGLAVAASHWGACVTAGVLVSLGLLVHAYLIVRFMPFAIRLFTICEVLLSLLQSVACFLGAIRAGMASNEGKASPSLLHAVVGITVAAQSLVFVVALMSCVSALYEWLQDRRNPRTIAPLSHSDNEMVPMAAAKGAAGDDGERSPSPAPILMRPLLDQDYSAQSGTATSDEGGGADTRRRLVDPERAPWLRQSFAGNHVGGTDGYYSPSPRNPLSWEQRRQGPPTVVQGAADPWNHAGSPVPRDPQRDGRAAGRWSPNTASDGFYSDPDEAGAKPRKEAPTEARVAAAGGAAIQTGTSALLFTVPTGEQRPYRLTEGSPFIDEKDANREDARPPPSTPFDRRQPANQPRRGADRAVAARHADEVYRHNAGEEIDRALRRGEPQYGHDPRMPRGGAQLASTWDVPVQQRLDADL